ncbi:MAG: hypothetical protein JWS12_108 [Candidatus Saccharibacteria bacterium]|nr:hypothetical protein [Candidatus Saccharibacteria bacterium]
MTYQSVYASISIFMNQIITTPETLYQDHKSISHKLDVARMDVATKSQSFDYAEYVENEAIRQAKKSRIGHFLAKVTPSLVPELPIVGAPVKLYKLFPFSESPYTEVAGRIKQTEASLRDEAVKNHDEVSEAYDTNMAAAVADYETDPDKYHQQAVEEAQSKGIPIHFSGDVAANVHTIQPRL